MSPSVAATLTTRMQQALRSVGEVFAFVGVVGYAIGRLLLGRWPEPPRMDRRAKSRRAERTKVEKIGPYPLTD